MTRAEIETKVREIDIVDHEANQAAITVPTERTTRLTKGSRFSRHDDCNGDGCFFCDGTGEVCDGCGEPPAACGCDADEKAGA